MSEQVAVAPGSSRAAPVVLRADNVTKRFPGVVANHGVTLDVRAGTVHCLLGENGAGKSTLADMFYGVHTPDEGVVEFRGDPYRMTSPKDAINVGIGMVRQHFELVAPMSVLENVVLGTRGERRLDLAAARDRLEELCRTYNVDIDADSAVGGLPVGQQQWVEILKALYLGVEVLILDEPTAVLTPDGVQRLFEALRKMTAQGLTVVLITHKLHEVMSISDEVTILRKGRVVATVETATVSPRELTQMMVGRDVELTIEVPEAQTGDIVVEVRDVSHATKSGRGSLHDVSMSIRAGEILGLAGVSGNGQDALFDVLVGMAAPDRGSVEIDGLDIGGMSARDILRHGVASVPADRIKQALMMDFEVRENLILGRHRFRRFARNGMLRRSRIEDFATDSFDGFKIAAPSTAHQTRVLSGGNLQKIVMARELGDQPKFLVAHQPTRGLDIGAGEYVRRQLLTQRDSGSAILLISEDLDELLNLSTRIAVMFDGRIVGAADRNSATREQIGQWMAGIHIEPDE